MRHSRQPPPAPLPASTPAPPLTEENDSLVSSLIAAAAADSGAVAGIIRPAKLTRRGVSLSAHHRVGVPTPRSAPPLPGDRSALLLPGRTGGRGRGCW